MATTHAPNRTMSRYDWQRLRLLLESRDRLVEARLRVRQEILAFPEPTSSSDHARGVWMRHMAALDAKALSLDDEIAQNSRDLLALLRERA